MSAGTFQSLAPSVYARIAPHVGGANTGYVDTDRGGIVVDAAESPEAGKRDLSAIRRIRKAPLHALLLTHHHSDHWFGAQVFDCPVIASEAACREMREAGTAYLDEVRDHHRHLRDRLAAVRLRYPDRTFGDRLAFDTDPAVELLCLGGHTRGTSVVYIPRARVLFASDLVFHGVHPYTKGSDLTRWIAALERLVRLRPSIVVPGHGPTGGIALLIDQRSYLCRFTETLGDLKARGVSLDRILADPSLLGLPDLHRPRRLAGGVRFHWDRL